MSAAKPQYTDAFIAALQWMWGDGYLSPGGPQEVAAMLRDIDVEGRHVVDVGCGLGAIDVTLVEQHKAASVLGLDVEAQLLQHARERVATAGLDGRIRFKLVEPGPLPLRDASCDMVFSKDAIIHIPDKSAFFAEVMRVLTPGGVFVGSDWLRGGDDTFTEQARGWLEFVKLRFEMRNLEQTRQSLVDTGFERVALTDRNDWYRNEVRVEVDALSGDKFTELARRIGEEHATHRRASTTLKKTVIEQGFLRPTHFVGYKPAR